MSREDRYIPSGYHEHSLPVGVWLPVLYALVLLSYHQPCKCLAVYFPSGFVSLAPLFERENTYIVYQGGAHEQYDYTHTIHQHLLLCKEYTHRFYRILEAISSHIGDFRIVVQIATTGND